MNINFYPPKKKININNTYILKNKKQANDSKMPMPPDLKHHFLIYFFK